MAGSISETDWKVFRRLHPIALGRYCQRVLDEIAQIAADTKATPHERYLQIYKVVEQRDRTMGEAFNDVRRSTAIMQLLTIHSHGLITEDEIGLFTQDTREVLSRFSPERT